MDRKLVLALDALGDDLQVETVADRTMAWARMAPCSVTASRHEGTVDLEHIDGKVLEVGERGIAGAEVIDRDPDAIRPQLSEHVHGALRVLHQHALGDSGMSDPGRQAPTDMACDSVRPSAGSWN